MNTEELPFSTQLTKFEKTRLIGTRAEQLANGAIPTVNVSYGMSMLEIATKEYENGTIPVDVIRTLPDGSKITISIQEKNTNKICKKCFHTEPVMFLYSEIKCTPLKNTNKKDKKNKEKQIKFASKGHRKTEEFFDVEIELKEDENQNQTTEMINVWTREPFEQTNHQIFVDYSNSRQGEHHCERYTLDEWNSKGRKKHPEFYQKLKF